jgi:hypothetical protein
MQAYVVTRDQALGHGLSRHSIDRLVESGAWRRLARGLFLTVPLEWHVIREVPGVRAARSVKDPPRLTVESTVLDLADVRDVGEVVGLITTAVQRRLTTVKKLRRELDERARHRHRALLRDLLSDVEVGAESPIELRYLRDVERSHGLPKGNRQQSRSGLPYQTDVDYEEFRLIVELDGRVDHESVGRFRDMDRDNRHALVDAVTLRYGSYDLAARPCGVAFQVYRALAARGYLEAFLRCRHCSAAPED